MLKIAMDDSTHIHQLNLLRNSEIRCLLTMNDSLPPNHGLYCPRMWDGAYCWPHAKAGEVVTAPCPEYIHGFNPEATASKFCTDDGTWWRHPELNVTWSNYSLCKSKTVPDEASAYVVHIPVIKAISQAGYSVSLTMLLVACLLLGSVRRLRCPRNNLHLQLFTSFIFRASVSLARDFVNQQGINQDSDVICKSLMAIWQYSLMANYCWILMEGLYLHNLVFLSMFSDTAGILKYAIAGWGLPLLFVIPWAILKAMFEDNWCWTINENQNYFWAFIRGPITASIVLNLVFFINITRVLFLKMFASQAIQSRRYRYRKWFKSTLVLVPLFGVHYALLLTVSLAAGLSETLEVAWLYLDVTFASFQGSFVSLLYCFLNGEVQSEVKKIYERLREKDGHNPQNSLLTQSLTYLSKGRSSLQSLHMVTEKKDNLKNGDVALVVQESAYHKSNKERITPEQQHTLAESVI